MEIFLPSDAKNPSFPIEMVNEYDNSNGTKVRGDDSIIYGYSMTIGPHGIPHIREFGNFKSFKSNRSENEQNKRKVRLGSSRDRKQPESSTSFLSSPFSNNSLSYSEKEPLVDVNYTDREIKIVLEMPGIKKESIKINAYEDGTVEIYSNDYHRKFHKTIQLQQKEVDFESARSTHNNGILEIIFYRKRYTKSDKKIEE